MMNKILVIDDEKNILSSFTKILNQEGYQVSTAHNAEDGLERVRAEKPGLVIMDIRMPGMSGIEAVSEIRQVDAKIPIILMTAFGTIDTAIEAMKAGAYEYVIKPFDISEMKEMVKKALEVSRLMNVEVGYERPEGFTGDRIIGNSIEMQKVYKLIGQVAESNVNILLRGESGVGKELIARAIYFHSKRKDKPFVVINSAAIPDALLESELFGHERGAFTDAKIQRIGKLEQCDGGTLFLDEIGDMSVSIQAKILRVLENQSFERLGGNRPIKVNVRFITATHKDLEQLVAEGKFREDLFYRLNAMTIAIPPLRERREDIPLMVDHFLKEYSREFGKDVQQASGEGLKLLGHHGWPGNVRELENVIKKAVLLGQGRVLLPDHLFLQGPGSEQPKSDTMKKEFEKVIGEMIKIQSSAPSGSFYADTIEQLEGVLIAEVLKQTAGNQTKAARLLGISRPTLKDRIEKLGLRKIVQIQES